jgi:hypothetical protein
MNRIGVIPLDERIPRGVEMVEIEPVSGFLGEGCRETHFAPFIEGSAPEAKARCYQGDSLMPEGLGWLKRLFE